MYGAAEHKVNYGLLMVCALFMYQRYPLSYRTGYACVTAYHILLYLCIKVMDLTFGSVT